MITFFSECFYVFSQVYVSKYLILLQAYDRIHITVVNDHNLDDFSMNS